MMEEFVFDCDESSDSGGGKFTVPPGEYNLTVWDILSDEKNIHPKLGEPWRCSKSGHPQLNVRLGINGQGGKLWVYNTLTFIPKDMPGHNIIVHSLKTLGAVIKDGKLVNFKPGDLVGRVCRAKLTLETPAGSKYPKNKISEMLYADPDVKAEMPAEDEDAPF
jgi:hypothetical protein